MQSQALSKSEKGLISRAYEFRGQKRILILSLISSGLHNFSPIGKMTEGIKATLNRSERYLM